MNLMRPVAVAGMGCIASPGGSLDECMAALYAGRRRPVTPSRFETDIPLDYPVFEVEDRHLRSDGEAGAVPRTVALALTAAREAMEDAALPPAAVDPLRMGVCLGTNVGGSVSNAQLRLDEDCKAPPSPLERFAASNPTVALMAAFGCQGQFQTVVNACSAGNDAIGIAAGWITAGRCDLVLAGGADELYPVTYRGFRALFINADAPCRPFDRRRKGLNLGEGAAILVLASDKLCQRAGLTPRGYVLGYGTSADAHHFTHPRPDGKGMRCAQADALAQSGLAAEAITFINAHGTGTQGNDLAESKVFAEDFTGTPFLSTKGYTGHTLGAAGAVEAAFTLACLERQLLPATAGFEVPDPDLPANPTAVNTPIRGARALSQTLAFGGSNSVLILEGEGREDEAPDGHTGDRRRGRFRPRGRRPARSPHGARADTPGRRACHRPRAAHREGASGGHPSPAGLRPRSCHAPHGAPHPHRPPGGLRRPGGCRASRHRAP
jgi:3-oxoacyl-[acyl-carrier-protein] synthase-1/3-oxoacyl-[acyl-carrier-protein] synthase II